MIKRRRKEKKNIWKIKYFNCFYILLLYFYILTSKVKLTEQGYWCTLHHHHRHQFLTWTWRMYFRTKVRTVIVWCMVALRSQTENLCKETKHLQTKEQSLLVSPHVSVLVVFCFLSYGFECVVPVSVNSCILFYLFIYLFWLVYYHYRYHLNLFFLG